MNWFSPILLVMVLLWIVWKKTNRVSPKPSPAQWRWRDDLLGIRSQPLIVRFFATYIALLLVVGLVFQVVLFCRYVLRMR